MGIERALDDAARGQVAHHLEVSSVLLPEEGEAHAAVVALINTDGLTVERGLIGDDLALRALVLALLPPGDPALRGENLRIGNPLEGVSCPVVWVR